MQGEAAVYKLAVPREKQKKPSVACGECAEVNLFSEEAIEKAKNEAR